MVEAEAGIIAGFGEPVVWEREFNPNLPVKKVESLRYQSLKTSRKSVSLLKFLEFFSRFRKGDPLLPRLHDHFK